MQSSVLLRPENNPSPSNYIYRFATLSLKFLSHKIGFMEVTLHRGTFRISNQLACGKRTTLAFKNNFGKLELIATYRSLIGSLNATPGGMMRTAITQPSPCQGLGVKTGFCVIFGISCLRQWLEDWSEVGAQPSFLEGNYEIQGPKIPEAEIEDSVTKNLNPDW